jgi:hypothetical protein
MKENGIFIKHMYECMVNNKKEINNMDKIFDSDNELSIRKRLVLLKLISRDPANKNVKYYTNAINFNAWTIDDDMQEFKALIVTALMFNLDFYVSACNWCGLIQSEMKKIKKNQSNIEYKKITIYFVYRPPKNKAEMKVLTADTPGDSPKPFDKLHVDDIKGKYYGDLICLGNRKNQSFELRFRFFDKKTKKAVRKIPFYLDVELILNSDLSQIPFSIKLNQRLNSSTIYSKTEYIDFTEGFRICKISEV